MTIENHYDIRFSKRAKLILPSQKTMITSLWLFINLINFRLPKVWFISFLCISETYWRQSFWIILVECFVIDILLIKCFLKILRLLFFFPNVWIHRDYYCPFILCSWIVLSNIQWFMSFILSKFRILKKSEITVTVGFSRNFHWFMWENAK
jgi:hypothetical protein